MQYIYFKRGHRCSICEHTFIEGAVVKNFPEFLGKCRSCVLLNETSQKFIWKISTKKGIIHLSTHFRCTQFNRTLYYCFFSSCEILLVMFPRLLLHVVLKTLICKIKLTQLIIKKKVMRLLQHTSFKWFQTQISNAFYFMYLVTN